MQNNKKEEPAICFRVLPFCLNFQFDVLLGFW